MNFSRDCIRKNVIALAVILSISGTAFASQEGNGTSLRSDACAALGKAVAVVAEADRRGALWIPAQAALDDARAAFARGDYREAIAKAQLAQRFAELGIEQLDSAPFKDL